MVQLIAHNFLVFLILEVDFSHLFHISRFLCIFMTWFRRVDQWLRSQWLQTTIAYLASKDYVITLIVMISDNSIISTTLSEFFFSISLFRLTSQSLLSSHCPFYPSTRTKNFSALENSWDFCGEHWSILRNNYDFIRECN